jgi:hypothetical protein
MLCLWARTPQQIARHAHNGGGGGGALRTADGWPTAFVVYGVAGLALTTVWVAVGRDAPATPELCVPDACELPDDDEPAPPALSPSDAAGTAWAKVRALPWGEIAAAPPIWAMTAAAVASNYFLCAHPRRTHAHAATRASRVHTCAYR